MSGRPYLFCLADCPAGGDFGSGTGQLELSVCKVCSRPLRPPDYTIIEVVFDEWDGEDLVLTRGLYIVSARLRAALQAAGITGATYEDTIVSVSPGFELGPSAYQNNIPDFYHWRIESRLDGPATWWSPTGTCPTCGESAWEISEEVKLASYNNDEWGLVPRRMVYEDSWNGADVFLLRDPGPPLVTDRVVAVFERLSVASLEVVPADWVRRG